MSDIALKVENLYKRYRLGAVDRQAFKEDIIGWWAAVRGKPDPYEQYITSNDLAAIQDSEEMKKLKARYVWALQDINFEVKKGEIVGIIGKNGAGKSTLLKILSKTTTPTKGQVKVNGRIASLLEVGTGFHGELTGRENIYLNGAILGMTRHEIKRHLDEIIAFAGVDAYIDTPVKRYSSGMYVRLAFAVGAHLLSDILIVDEVLAVGDAEFQKKCIGKMQDVSTGEGKTVLFVSHDMRAVKSLCEDILVLKNGNIDYHGNIENGITKYLSENNLYSSVKYPIIFDEFVIETFKIIQNGVEVSEIFSDYETEIYLDLSLLIDISNFRIGLKIFNNTSDLLLVSLIGDWDISLNTLKKGNYTLKLKIPNKYFNSGSFKFQLHASITPIKDFNLEKLTNKNIQIHSSSDFNMGFPNEQAFGFLTLNQLWQIKKH